MPTTAQSVTTPLGSLTTPTSTTSKPTGKTSPTVTLVALPKSALPTVIVKLTTVLLAVTLGTAVLLIVKTTGTTVTLSELLVSLVSFDFAVTLLTKVPLFEVLNQIVKVKFLPLRRVP